MKTDEKIEILKSVFFGEEDWESMKHRANIMNTLKSKEDFITKKGCLKEKNYNPKLLPKTTLSGTNKEEGE